MADQTADGYRDGILIQTEFLENGFGIDPHGCGCVDCITGQAFNVSDMHRIKAAVNQGRTLYNRTGHEVFLSNGSRLDADQTWRAPAAPIPFTVTRYRCPHCTRTRSKKAAIGDHIQICWHNPDVQTCRTCSAGDCSPGRGHGYDDGYPAYQHCRIGLALPEDGTPVVGCPSWTTKENDRA